MSKPTKKFIKWLDSQLKVEAPEVFVSAMWKAYQKGKRDARARTCKWVKHGRFKYESKCIDIVESHVPKYCPDCGRRVKVEESK